MVEIQDWEKTCLLLLGEMHAGAEQKWSKGKAELYLVVLRSLGKEWSVKAVQRAILTEEWRPSPARLREIAATLASPMPPCEPLWGELWHKCVHQGYDAPRWTHPILEDIAAGLGGWRFLRGQVWPDTEPRQIEALHRRFEQAYQSCAAAWQEAVAEQLPLPAPAREPRYRIGEKASAIFTPPKSLPPGEDRLPALPTLAEIEAQMPAHIAVEFPALRRHLKRLDAPKETAQRSSGLDAETRREIEAELAARQSHNGRETASHGAKI